jgi:hypothetical protein
VGRKSPKQEKENEIEQLKEVASQALQALSVSLEQGQSKYLAAVGKFHRYSASNILLIVAQRPAETRVAGYQARRKLRRHVTRGTKGITIFLHLVPRTVKTSECGIETDRQSLVGYRAAVAFDVADTTGDPLPSLSEFEGNPRNYLTRL